MATWLNPYLQFHGATREAMEYYQSIFGGKLDLVTGADFGLEDQPDIIMHAHLKTEGGWTFMASDCEGTKGAGLGDPAHAMCIGGDAAAKPWFDALAEDGEVLMPLSKQQWGSTHGAVLDKFGVRWMFDLEL